MRAVKTLYSLLKKNTLLLHAIIKNNRPSSNLQNEQQTLCNSSFFYRVYKTLLALKLVHVSLKTLNKHMHIHSLPKKFPEATVAIINYYQILNFKWRSDNDKTFQKLLWISWDIACLLSGEFSCVTFWADHVCVQVCFAHLTSYSSDSVSIIFMKRAKIVFRAVFWVK